MTTAKPTPRSILAERLKQLGVELQGVATAPDDPAAVHDLRVAIRRFSQALRIFPEGFGPAPAKKIRRKLKKAMGTLGAVRNLDIALEILDAAGAAPGPRLVEHIQQEKRNAQKDLAAELKSWRKGEVLANWKTMLQGRPRVARSVKQAHEELPDLAAEFLEAGNDATGRKAPYRRLHRCRLLGKRLRYTIEMFGAEIFGVKEFRRRLNMLKELQDHLGGLNDCVTVIELIKGHATVKQKIRALLALREQEFRTFWQTEFEAEVRQWKERNGTVSAPPRRRRTA